MQMYQVIVDPMSIRVEKAKELNNVHYRALVDGEPVNYQILAGANRDLAGGKINKKFFERGAYHVMYHARNLGETVIWLEAYRKPKKSKKEVSKKQRKMF